MKKIIFLAAAMVAFIAYSNSVFAADIALDPKFGLTTVYSPDGDDGNSLF